MSANTLTVRGFLNSINYVAGVKEDSSDDKYFAKIAYTQGKAKQKQTQFLSCFISTSLNGIAQAAYESQTTSLNDDGKERVSNILGSQFAELTIINPFFKINAEGYLDGGGILTNITFLTPAKPKSSK